VELGLARNCPGGCTNPLCAFNDDPAGEIEILRRTSHYSAIHAIEALLLSCGITRLNSPSAGAPRRVRRDDFHAAIDRIIVESKIARRGGNRVDLGRYDERFAGLFLSWVPTEMSTPEGPRLAPGAPHVIRIKGRVRLDPERAVGETTQPGAMSFPEQAWTSGQPMRPPALAGANKGLA